MHEDLLHKMIRTKIEIGAYMINELPAPLQQRAKGVLNIFQEELTSYIQEQKQPAETSLKPITIE
ncbi:DUF3926 domain-containing protein [Bacillus sp. NPDC077411]|uniref:DUF3926 domain-containing protein n=1 Tax=Bacillus bruguierae TaxID=3127667 RepID=A0ABU8FI96_9BACI|nr:MULTISPECIES: DUF3926 domain-containing protein [unclassified Bacillus (in: firmicutes)]SFJ53382.1 Protein of unknown function [Bacillus sp. 71mf]SFT19246.1 Protein of unknown function [Bacillus sp. 103mf]